MGLVNVCVERLRPIRRVLCKIKIWSILIDFYSNSKRANHIRAISPFYWLEYSCSNASGEWIASHFRVLMGLVNICIRKVRPLWVLDKGRIGWISGDFYTHWKNEQSTPERFLFFTGRSTPSRIRYRVYLLKMFN